MEGCSRESSTPNEVFNFYQEVVEFDSAYKELVTKFTADDLRELLQHYISDLIPSKNSPIINVHNCYVDFEKKYASLLKAMKDRWGNGAPNVYKLLNISNGIIQNTYIANEYKTIITRERIEE